MEKTMVLPPENENIAKLAFIIEKVHRCDECPIRKAAEKQPKSILGQLHNWHKKWWPAWKAHQERTCGLSEQLGN